jgi:uncharacterized heparinase superfamily protein
MLQRLRRELAFAAAVPPRQIARRFWLTARRGAERRLQPTLPSGGATRVAQPPRPLFPPRHTGVQADADGWAFRFVGREHRIALRVDWRAPGPGAADQLWRMNLHYMEYLEALTDRQAAELIGQWIEANPPFAPGSTSDAWNAYTVSLRVTVWMQQLAARGLPGDVVARAEQSLVQQLAYLERHLETDIGGNHLIKNIKALLWASAYFEGPAAARWRRLGLRLLARELPLQMLSDGMHFERSPSYHCQVTADLLEIRHALGSDPLRGELDARLEQAAQLVADLAHPDGRVAQFGDSGLAMAYAPAEVLAAHTRLFGDAPSARPTFAYPEAGYFGIRTGGDMLVIDAGIVAPASLPAHGHGDMLSFEWSVAGQRLIVDQGVFEYQAGHSSAARYRAGERRTAARAAASHNTVSIKGMEQAEFYGAFRCGRQGRMTVIERAIGADALVLEAEHDGFRRLHGGPIHRRRFAGSASAFRIDDSLTPPGDRPARAALLLHPEVEVEREGVTAIRLRRGPARARIEASGALAAEPAVWWPDMGEELATTRLVLPLPAGSGRSWLTFAALTS